MRNILLSLFVCFFLSKKTMFSSVSYQDSHSDKEKILVCKKNYTLDNSFLLYRISNRFVQGIAGKKTRYLFLLGM